MFESFKYDYALFNYLHKPVAGVYLKINAKNYADFSFQI